MARFNPAMQMALAQALGGAPGAAMPEQRQPDDDMAAALGFGGPGDMRAQQEALAAALGRPAQSADMQPGQPGADTGLSAGMGEQPVGDFDFTRSMADALANQRTVAEGLKRQRAAGNLGLLSGDRVLGRFGQAQLDQAETGDPTSLRHLSLVQAQQRLAIQAEAEKRRGNVENRKANRDDEKFAFDQKKHQDDMNLALQRMARDSAAARLKAEKDAGKEAREREAELDKQTDGLRREFNSLPAVKDHDTVAQSYETLLNSYQDMTGPGAINTIFATMKILDPGVSVMGGDVELIRNSGGKAAALAGLVDSVRNGNPLTAETRNNLLRQGTTQYEARRKQYNEARNMYEGLAKKRGVDSNLVFLPRDDVRIGGSGDSTSGNPPRIGVTEALPTGADGNPTLDASPASGQGALPRIISLKGLKPGDLANQLKDGESVRIPKAGGGYQTVRKSGSRLLKVSE